MNTPRHLTLDDVMAKIHATSFTVLPNGVTTVCQLTMENGFTVEGSSACVDPSAYDEKIGRENAFRNAVDAAWPFEGYMLKQRMFEAGLPVPPPMPTPMSSIESVAEAVHEGWAAGKRKAGIQTRVAEDGEELMVPWAALSEKAKQQNRDMVRTVFDAVAATAA